MGGIEIQQGERGSPIEALPRNWGVQDWNDYAIVKAGNNFIIDPRGRRLQ
jgi:hypothetical protein